jgi:hypothetical protein
MSPKTKNNAHRIPRSSSKKAHPPVRGGRYWGEIGGVEKFKRTRRQARRAWAREDRQY